MGISQLGQSNGSFFLGRFIVKDQNGNPIKGALVSISLNYFPSTSLSRISTRFEDAILTNESGLALLEIPTGRYLRSDYTVSFGEGIAQQSKSESFSSGFTEPIVTVFQVMPVPPSATLVKEVERAIVTEVERAIITKAKAQALVAAESALSSFLTSLLIVGGAGVVVLTVLLLSKKKGVPIWTN